MKCSWKPTNLRAIYGGSFKTFTCFEVDSYSGCYTVLGRIGRADRAAVDIGDTRPVVALEGTADMNWAGGFADTVNIARPRWSANIAADRGPVQDRAAGRRHQQLVRLCKGVDLSAEQAVRAGRARDRR